MTVLIKMITISSEIFKLNNSILSVLKLFILFLRNSFYGALLRWIAIDTWLGSNISLDALVGLSAAILALLIPIVILVVESNKDSSFPLDNQVFFHELINPKKFISSFLFITVFLIAWKLSLKPFIIIFYSIGIYYFVILLKNLYNWISAFDGKQNNFKKTKRKKYLLDNSVSDEEATSVWKLIWSQNNILNPDNSVIIRPYFDISEFFDLFKKRYLHMRTSKSKFATGFLSNFVYNFDKLSFSRSDVFSSIYLFTSKNIFSNINNQDNKKKLSDDFFLFDQLMESILDRAFSEQNQLYILFALMNKTFDEQTIKVSARFINRFGLDIFKRAGKLKNNKIFFSSFPDKWKINSEKITLEKNEPNTNKLNKISIAWYYAYLNFLNFKNFNDGGLSFYGNDKTDSDDSWFVQELTVKIIEKADPILFSDLYLLSVNHPDIESVENRKTLIYQWVIQKKKFGLIGRVYSFSGDDNERMNNELKGFQYEASQEALELAYLSFKTIRDKEFLEFTLRYLKSNEIRELMKKDNVNFIESLIDSKIQIISNVLSFLNNKQKN
ncbi:hypothetical protein [Oenococcus oeni]|uniref:hypothetical protein n=1 Tax=Oenococcus oeni TaxID=1247 RepID=UPI00126833AA|nr:hypothetical protein [Oenococcus oeni]